MITGSGRSSGGGAASSGTRSPIPSLPSQLYELDADPKRKEFLDDLFSFMQKRGEVCLSGGWALLAIARGRCVRK